MSRRLFAAAASLVALGALAAPVARATTAAPTTTSVRPASTWACLTIDPIRFGVCLDNPFPQL